MISDVLYFEKQETWLWQETCRAWQFHSVYLTTASGVQQRASTLKQEKGVLRFMSLMKHFRNFALSEVKNSFLKLSLSTYFRFCRLCLRWKGLVLLLSHFIDLTLSFNGMQLFKKICYSTDSFYHIIQIFVHGTCKNVRQFSEIKFSGRGQTDVYVTTELYCVIYTQMENSWESLLLNLFFVFLENDKSLEYSTTMVRIWV